MKDIMGDEIEAGDRVYTFFLIHEITGFRLRAQIGTAAALDVPEALVEVVNEEGTYMVRADCVLIRQKAGH